MGVENWKVMFRLFSMFLESYQYYKQVYTDDQSETSFIDRLWLNVW
jgi:hypothetical protein